MNSNETILIVDDDASIAMLLKEAFRSSGYRCDLASSAEAALEFLHKTCYSLMLTDVALPGMSGLELTRQAKLLCPELVTIVMTGFLDDFSYDSAIEAGASDFIKKPFTLKELRARISHVELQEKNRRMAITDELTGLYNRRGFFTLAEQLLRLSKRQMSGMFMLYADVDNMKSINDTLGHQAGDAALIEAAAILKSTYRESDIAARIGGDEFVVIPIGTAGDNVELITERLRQALSIHNARERRQFDLSISIGVTYYDPVTPCSLDELLRRGDNEMYCNKRQKQLS